MPNRYRGRERSRRPYDEEEGPYRQEDWERGYDRWSGRGYGRVGRYGREGDYGQMRGGTQGDYDPSRDYGHEGRYGREYRGPWMGRDWEDDYGEEDWEGGREGRFDRGYGRRFMGRDWEDEYGAGVYRSWEGGREGRFGQGYGGEHGGRTMGRGGEGEYGQAGNYAREGGQLGRDWKGSYGRGFGGEDWMRSGPATGRGPRGYQRSDDRIREDVCDRLTQHGQIDASDMEVEVRNGEVILSGTVANRQAKRMAEDTVEAVLGVKNVQNNLRVQP
jgi:hypothetical protein